MFANKTSHFVASWYQPPGRNLVELTSELLSQIQKIKGMHKGNKSPSVDALGDFNFGDVVWPERLKGHLLRFLLGKILIAFVARK